MDKFVYPLSGRGKRISWQTIENGRLVTWGNTTFDLKNEMINDILNNYFIDAEKWYPLGASMTDPISGSLGEYIQNKFTNLTPRHASAIAAIMVKYDHLLEEKGKKPIMLKKIKNK